LEPSDTYEEHRDPLSAAERGVLRTGLALICGFTVLCVALFSFVFHFVLADGDSHHLFAYAVGAFAAIFAVVIGVQLRRVLFDLSVAEVVVLRGRVAAKSSLVPRRGRGTRGHRRSYLHLGERRIEVSLSQFGAAREQDLVEIRMGPHSKRVFSVQVVEAAGPPEPRETGTQPATQPATQTAVPAAAGPAATRVELALSDEDRRVLRGLLLRAVLRRLLGIAVSAYFFLYFAIEQLWGLVLLMSPMVLVCAWQSFALARETWRYAREARDGVKLRRSLPITDRQVETRRGQRYVLVARGERFEVPRSTYEAIEVGEIMHVDTGLHTGWQLKLTGDTAA
jgi:hypothetical protein